MPWVVLGGFPGIKHTHFQPPVASHGCKFGVVISRCESPGTVFCLKLKVVLFFI